MGCAALWLLAFQGGCSSDDDPSPVCTSRCAEVCKALAACDTPPADCEAQCSLGLGSSCSGPPADQLTCAELKGAYACADYCATLCTRAPECGSFDARKCAIGCAAERPQICNPASVAARSCDQLKPELRSYDRRAELEQGSGIAVPSGPDSSTSYGLCRTGGDCQLPLGCSAVTSTCSACEADAECAQPGGHYACSAMNECTKVACLVDADCSLSFSGISFCDGTLHVCGECHSNADCKHAILGGVCDEAAMKCVGCVDDGDCTKDAPRCDTGRQTCELCESDKDCKGQPGTPFCEFECVQCRTDSDCAGTAHPSCAADGRCE